MLPDLISANGGPIPSSLSGCKMVVMALELVPTFKRLFGSDVPKGNARRPRTQGVLNMRAS